MRAALLADGTTWVTGIQLVRFDDGRIVLFGAVLAPSMYLQEAQRLSEHGEAKRQLALESIGQDRDGNWRVRDRPTEFDAIASLAASVTLAFTPIEAYANELVARLPDGAVVDYERDGQARSVSQDRAVDRLRTGEKLRFVLPVITGNAIWETDTWETFDSLRRLRNDLVHLRDRGISTDVENPSAFGRILRGDGSSAPRQAAAIIEAAEPGWIRGQTLRSSLALDA